MVGSRQDPIGAPVVQTHSSARKTERSKRGAPWHLAPPEQEETHPFGPSGLRGIERSRRREPTRSVTSYAHPSAAAGPRRGSDAAATAGGRTRRGVDAVDTDCDVPVEWHIEAPALAARAKAPASRGRHWVRRADQVRVRCVDGWVDVEPESLDGALPSARPSDTVTSTLRNIGLGLSLMTLLAGCNNTARGAVIGGVAGGAAGAGIGAAIGKGKGAAIGAIVGAAVGGATGAVIGKVMDDRARQIERDLEGARVERVGEGILVTFKSGILFDVDRADLKSAARENIQSLTEVLERYDDTDVVVAGHTDATGKEDYNLQLSRRRAQAVADYARSHGVSANRIRIVGEGESTPIASNDTADGRRQNRRVEIAIFANDKLRRAAERRAG